MHDAQNLISWQAPASDDSQVSSGKVSTWSQSACLKVFKSLHPCIYIYSMFSLRSFAACLCHFWVGTIPELRIWCSWALGIRMEISSMARNGRHSAAGCQSTLPFHGTMRTRRPGNAWRRSSPYYPWHFSFGQVLQTVTGENGWRHRKQWIWRYPKVYVQDLIEEQGQHVCKLLDAWLKRQPSGESCQSNGKIGNIFI